MGCVLPAGQGQAPARQAAFGAGLPEGVPCATVNKMCGSGMKTVMMGMDALRAGEGRVIVAGGMESMTNAPYIAPKMRGGARLGHVQMFDHMFLDGLEDAYDKGRLMGTFAEDCAEAYQFTRESQDEYALASLDHALRAQKEGWFDREIATVTVAGRKGEAQVSTDEQPRNARPDKIPTLKPAFRNDGTVTPANSSSISDGAAALVLMREADANGHEIRARIVAHSSHAQKPSLFTTAPVAAIRKVLDKAGWELGDVDLWEINEAFAVVPMAAMRELGIPAREAERQRRRLRARPPDRRFGRAHHRHAVARDGTPRRQARRRQPLHRRRRGHRGRDRAGLTIVVVGTTALRRVGAKSAGETESENEARQGHGGRGQPGGRARAGRAS